MAERNATIGFVGLGPMGLPMAFNVLKAGHHVVVHDADHDSVQALVSAGGKAAEDPAGVAACTSCWLLMVDTAKQAKDQVFGERGLLRNAKAGDLLVLLGTIDMADLKDMNARLADHGIDLVDAPVSGMRAQAAANATLKCYVGGPHNAVERALPVLRTMASDVILCGEIGLGTAMKLVNGLLMQVQRVVIAEAIVMGTKAGLSPQTIIEAFSRTAGNSAAFQQNAQRMQSRNFDGIALDITTRDIEMQNTFGQSLGMPMYMTAMALHVHNAARTMGMGSLDAAALVQVYEQFTGTPPTLRFDTP